MTEKELIDLISGHERTRELGITKIIQKRYKSISERTPMLA